MMTSRDRLLAAIHNEKPDRLPVQVHGWMDYYLNKYLDGIDQWQAYERFDMDMVIYTGLEGVLTDEQQANWVAESGPRTTDSDGVINWNTVIHTPGGDLTQSHSSNEITTWETDHLIESERDFELFEKYATVPTLKNAGPREIKERLGDRGIVRCGAGAYGQGSPWQDLCTLMGTVPAIMCAMDTPERMHHMLEVILQKRLERIEKSEPNPCDIIETGGGAGSDTVISPDLHAEFCVPYDKRQHDAIHAKDPHIRIVYHLCGGLMHMLDNVVANDADGLETMTPISMGGNTDMAVANEQVGDKLFFIGGFDQQSGFERGTPKAASEQVYQLFSEKPQGGYICCASDHFFHGDPENIQAFVDAAKDCVYN
jgi:uroporphyrinogen decarboxylase